MEYNRFIKLNEAVSYISKGIPPKYTESIDSNSVCVLNQKCNKHFKVNFDSARWHDTTVKKIVEEKLLNVGDVLINSTGTGTAGRVAQIDCLEQQTTVDGHMIILRGKAFLDKTYFGYAIKAKQKQIEHLAEGSTGQTEINRTRLLDEVEIFVPTPEEQVFIGRFLKSIDDKIEVNNEINDNLEQQAQALFKSWFVDFEPFGGVMPIDWEIASFGSFVTIKRGGSPRPIQEYLSDSGLSWLKISDVSTLNTPFINEIKEHIKETGLNKTVFLKAGSLVLSNSATPGIPKILDVDSCIHDGWLYFLNSQFSNEYMYLFFKHIKDKLLSFGNGSVFTNLKTDILKNFKSAKPPHTTLDDFDKAIQPMFCEIQHRTKENLRLSQLRDALLPQLMNGEIDVSKIEI